MNVSDANLTPFVFYPRVKDLFALFDTLREQNSVYGVASCVQITGESGSGKSELAVRYLLKHPSFEKEGRTVTPIVHYEFNKSVTSSKAFIVDLLVAIGDPQEGKNANREKELFDRFVDLCGKSGVELLILDEIQGIIQRRSGRVISDIADLFKDLIKALRIPIIFMGMPWAKYLIEANSQLQERIKYKFTIPPFRVSRKEYLDEYRKFLKILSAHYRFPDSCSFSIYQKEIALRIFAYTRGNVRRTINLLGDVYMNSKQSVDEVSLGKLQEVLNRYGIPDDQNPFLLRLEDLELKELVTHSDWDFNARRKDDSIVDGEYARFGVTKDHKLFSLRGAA